MDVFWTLPPISRLLILIASTVAASAFVVSVLGHKGYIGLYRLIFVPSTLWSIPPHIWRIFSSFIITGSGINMIMDPYFFYMYSSQLEKTSPRFTQPADYFVYLFFCGVIIIGLAGFLLGGYVFLNPLTLAVASTFAQENPNLSVGVFFFSVPGRYLPFTMLAITFILGGPDAAMFQGTGLLAAHMFDFLTRIWPEFGGGTNPVFTPAFLSRLFGYEPRRRGAGVAYPARNPGYDAGPAVATGNAWGSRGMGRRLGGE